MQTSARVCQQFYVAANGDFFGNARHSLQAQFDGIGTFMSLPKLIEPRVFCVIDQQRIYRLKILQGFEQNIGTPERLRAVAKSHGAGVSEVYHFRQFFARALSGHGANRMNLHQATFISLREIGDVVFSLNDGRGVWGKGGTSVTPPGAAHLLSKYKSSRVSGRGSPANAPRSNHPPLNIMP